MLVVLLLAAVFLPHFTGLADGKFFAPVAVRENVTIPDQRALIHFTNDVERLVIETRFTGAGTNFAWVIPLPAPPVIEAASSGVFPTLDFLFRSPIRHNFTRFYIAILVGTGLVALLVYARGSATLLLATLCLMFLIAGMFLPSLAKAKASASTDSGDAITVLDRRLVGVFETATIASRDPAALETWLRETGFRVPSNSARNTLFHLASAILDDQPRTRDEIRQELGRVLASTSEDPNGLLVDHRHGGMGWDNLLLGGPIREEDSPGNFTLRENGDELEFLGYDSQGAPHILESYLLRLDP